MLFYVRESEREWEGEYNVCLVYAISEIVLMRTYNGEIISPDFRRNTSVLKFIWSLVQGFTNMGMVHCMPQQSWSANRSYCETIRWRCSFNYFFWPYTPLFQNIFFPSNVLIIIKFHHKEFEVSWQFIVIGWDINV